MVLSRENPVYFTGKMFGTQFFWYDYALFSIMLGLSIGIGIYFGCFGQKKKNKDEYLLGSRRMQIFPVGMSLIASNISGLTLLGCPAETYFFGTQYSVTVLSFPIMGMMMRWIFLPVFYNLKLTSGLEYLKLRFDGRVSLLAIPLFIVKSLMYMSLVVYIAALGVNIVSGFDIKYITPVLFFVCVFYTSIGGYRGLVWSDTLQFSIAIVTTFVSIVVGIKSTGSLQEIWEKSKRGGRIEFFNIDPDPTVRTTFWGIIFGSTINWLDVYGLDPSSIQRYLSVPTFNKAKTCLIIFCAGVCISKLAMTLFGLVIYTYYADCDPFTAKLIRTPDQIILYFVMDMSRNIPGLAGLFIAGVSCTGLSAASTLLNTSAGSFYHDFVKYFIGRDTKEETSTRNVKIFTVVFGLLSFGLVFILEKLGGIIQSTSIFTGITGGPFLALYVLGMLFPNVTSKSVIVSTFSSLVLMSWIVIGAQIQLVRGNFKYSKKPLDISGCETSNVTSILVKNISIPDVTSNDEPLWIYRISFHWYTLLGALFSILVALIFNWVTRQENAKKNIKDLYSPIIQKCIPVRDYEMALKDNAETNFEKQTIILTKDYEKCDMIE